MAGRIMIAVLTTLVIYKTCMSFTLPYSTSTFAIKLKTPSPHQKIKNNIFPLYYKNHPSDDEEYLGSLERNIARTCVKQFLTQRSVQSFIFLLEQCRDPHTIRWIEDFSDTKNMLLYHGSGAFNLTKYSTWDKFLSEMMESPGATVVAEVKPRGTERFKNNPFMKLRSMEYDIDIDPPSLANRIISVREQIAKEWIVDLDVVAEAGRLILESYTENVIKERDDEEYKEGERHDTLSEVETNLHSSYGDKKRRNLFDRGALNMMETANTFNEVASSPLRKSSFDLLILLATQESIHRMLRLLKGGDDPNDAISYQWLRDFYLNRIDYFDGHQRYGRADDFLEDMLSTPPSVKKIKEDFMIIDPLGIAERIIVKRSDVAREWKGILNDTSLDHIDLRKKFLARKMCEKKIVEDGNDENEFQ